MNFSSKKISTPFYPLSSSLPMSSSLTKEELLRGYFLTFYFNVDEIDNPSLMWFIGSKEIFVASQITEHKTIVDRTRQDAKERWEDLRIDEWNPWALWTVMCIEQAIVTGKMTMATVNTYLESCGKRILLTPPQDESIPDTSIETKGKDERPHQFIPLEEFIAGKANSYFQFTYLLKTN